MVLLDSCTKFFALSLSLFYIYCGGWKHWTRKGSIVQPEALGESQNTRAEGKQCLLGHTAFLSWSPAMKTFVESPVVNQAACPSASTGTHLLSPSVPFSMGTERLLLGPQASPLAGGRGLELGEPGCHLVWFSFEQAQTQNGKRGLEEGNVFLSAILLFDCSGAIWSFS